VVLACATKKKQDVGKS